MAAYRRSICVSLLVPALCALSNAQAQLRVTVDTTAMRVIDFDEPECSRALIPVGARDVVFNCPAAFDSALGVRRVDGRCSNTSPQFAGGREWLAGLHLYADGLARFTVSTLRDSTARRITLVVAVRPGGACGLRVRDLWLGVTRPGPDWAIAVDYRRMNRSGVDGDSH